MTSTSIQAIMPLTVALSDPPLDGYFTPTQWTTLLSIIDTVIPSYKRESTSVPSPKIPTLPDIEYNSITTSLKQNLLSKPTDTQLDEYLAEKPSDSPEFQDLLRRTLVQYSREDARKGLAFLTSALKSALFLHPSC